MIKSYKILTELKPPRKFQYKIITIKLDDKNRKEILKWLKDNCGKYNQDYIYWALKEGNSWNGGHHHYGGSEIYFKTEELAMAFKIRWI